MVTALTSMFGFARAAVITTPNSAVAWTATKRPSVIAIGEKAWLDRHRPSPFAISRASPRSRLSAAPLSQRLLSAFGDPTS
jgi:hypothetical protein